jgi:hypothetical protein
MHLPGKEYIADFVGIVYSFCAWLGVAAFRQAQN